MFIVYDLIFLVFALVYLPVYLFKGKFHRGFFRRLGFLPPALALERPIWIHAVSVGEAVSIKKLAAELRKAYPGKKLVISTVTSTGNKIASGLVNPGDFLTYLPLDFSFIVNRVIKKIDPCLFIIAETEIWPNLISCLHGRKIPVITVNGRISDKSYSGYRAVRFLIRPILRKVDKFCVQSETDAFRLRLLGVAGDKIRVSGNVKFDISLDQDAGSREAASSLRGKLWLGPEDKLWVCGSTHPCEEEMILDAYRQLLVVLPGLKLLIAPRHTERARDIAGLVSGFSFTPVFISGLSGARPSCALRPVFILDVMGELSDYYSAADVVFVGGSLVPVGGHNILEPASRKKPVVFGPQMFNFRDISRMFLEKEAAFCAVDSRDLAEKIKQVLTSDLLAKQMAERAYELIIANRGATARNVAVIRESVSV